MADSESIEEILNQAAVQVATVVIMASTETDTESWPTTKQV